MITVFGRMANAKVANKVLEYLATQNQFKTAEEIAAVISENIKDVEHSILQIIEKYDWLSIQDTKSGLAAVRNGRRELDIKRYLDHGGFIKEDEEIRAADLEIKNEKELRKRVDESTVAVNENSLKYSKNTRIISILSATVAGLALLLELLRALKILPG